jgi:RND family efflux transporter MFP subunit
MKITKTGLRSLACLCAALSMAACGAKQGHDHAHEHETHTHEHHSSDGHDHSHDHDTHAHNHDAHNHEAQAHSHDEHDHSHDGHDHSHDTHQHEAEEQSHDGHDHGHVHGEGIAFTKQQAEAAGLSVEVVEEYPFYGVVKAAGHIQTPQGGESVVVATAVGVLYYATPSIVEGIAVEADKPLAGISAKKLQDGDPLQKARLAYETALAEYERAQRLVGDKIISAREFEQIRLRYETAKTTYEGQAQGMTERGASVSSPIKGYLKQVLVPNGAYVEVGQPVAVVTQTNRLHLRAKVSERDYGQLAKVSKAQFIPAYTDRLYRTDELNGKLLSYGRVADGAFVPVTFEIDNVGDLIAGSYAEVYLLTQPESGVVSVPVSALTEEQGLYFVYVQVCAEEYEKRSVRIGRCNGERVEILHGLHHGESVVTQGAYHVKLASMSTAIPHGHSH